MEIVGMRELQNAIMRLGKVPQKAVTKAARAGATPARKTARQLAPEDTGALKRGIILKAEKSRFKAKKVFDVMVNPAMNDHFVKAVKKPVHLKSNRAYYPASQEYGYFAVNGRYIPGFRYMERAMKENAPGAAERIITVMTEEIEKAWEGR